MEHCNVVIVGGGPAGLSAARRLADLGIRDVTVLEREQQAGGVPRHCGHLGFGWQSHRRIWKGPRFAAELRRGVANLDVRTATTVLRIEPDGMLHVQGVNGLSNIRARRILVTTGTRETPRAPRLVGGSRPQGVMNTGALQAHVYLHHHKPFDRPLIVGSEWVSFSAILTCRHLGIRPVAMIEEGPRITAPRPGDFIARLVYGVPVWTDTTLISVEGRSCVEGAVIECDGMRRYIDCDGVIFTGGFVPENALLRNAPDVVLAGNVHGTLKGSGLCWREGRNAADEIARSLR